MGARKIFPKVAEVVAVSLGDDGYWVNVVADGSASSVMIPLDCEAHT